MDRVNSACGAESKDLGDLILSMLFGAFRPPTPDNRARLRYTLDGHGYFFAFSTPRKDTGRPGG
jgi:hypothetical protein